MTLLRTFFLELPFLLLFPQRYMSGQFLKATTTLRNW